ncbi:MAG: NosD domain-containing protein [Armatimonadota bacterium]
MPKHFDFTHYHPAADGRTDDTRGLNQLFAEVAAAGGGTVTIPAGDYRLSGKSTSIIPSYTTVFAYGARFHLPEVLGDRARIVAFAGENVSDFNWFGGHFVGHCFDHRRPGNTWPPNANTRIFAVTTSAGGVTRGLTFRDVSGDRVAGAIINVEGIGVEGSESDVHTFAEDITIRDCNFVDCGKFMWDYGLLWQIMVWPEEYDEADVAMARRYFRNDLVREGVQMADGDDRVRFDNSSDPVPVAADASNEFCVCFFGQKLPANIVRGKKYFVVDSQPTYLRIAETFGGEPLTFSGSSGEGAGLIHNLSQAFYHLYVPTGCGPGKGCVDLVCCRNTNLTGNRMSALGDTMHLQRCHNNVFAGNQITGSRMGAFFLAEYCKNSTVTGNTIDGTNGSRVMSVEKSSEDTVIIGNTFRGGGRGCWINQPKNIIFQGNVFLNNTTKGERDPWRGRKDFETGDYGRSGELYFTLHEPSGQYGPVIIRDNIFVTGPECAETMGFAENGNTLMVEGNVFEGPVRTVRVSDGCSDVRIERNSGLD